MECMDVSKFPEKNKRIESCIHMSKEEVREQFGRKMSHDVSGNKKVYWKDE